MSRIRGRSNSNATRHTLTLRLSRNSATINIARLILATPIFGLYVWPERLLTAARTADGLRSISTALRVSFKPEAAIFAMHGDLHFHPRTKLVRKGSEHTVLGGRTCSWLSIGRQPTQVA